MSNEAAKALEREILGGEPFHYPCGCFGVVTSRHPNHPEFVQVRRLVDHCPSGTHDFVPAGCQGGGWHKRDGSRIPLEEWHAS